MSNNEGQSLRSYFQNNGAKWSGNGDKVLIPKPNKYPKNLKRSK